MSFVYPQTISEAAKILDTASPEWYKDINTDKLHMKSGTSCLLGQLYGDWYKGASRLFGDDKGQIPDYYDKLGDNVFGCVASKDSWLQEIKLRMDKQQDDTFDFAQALKYMAEGKKVLCIHYNTEMSLVKEHYQWKGGGTIILAKDVINSKYCLVNEIKFSDLKSGDKFDYIGNTYVKMNPFQISEKLTVNCIMLRNNTAMKFAENAVISPIK